MPFDSNPTATVHPLAACHEAQIDALTLPGLSDEERIRRFAEAAGFDVQQRTIAYRDIAVNYSAAYACWNVVDFGKSLFAQLPGCACPVVEMLSGFPPYVPDNWNPSHSDLELFARIQQERRPG